ncbi:MAG: aminotransferase class I/II-fold pyridoxal phosphate-dependent enzyme [Luteitalea sp.]|nr:aminotransferase class I/II-fold pyridoxal phosphate-dependent enzyme [Luteitalea sp.]
MPSALSTFSPPRDLLARRVRALGWSLPPRRRVRVPVCHRSGLDVRVAVCAGSLLGGLGNRDHARERDVLTAADGHRGRGVRRAPRAWRDAGVHSRPFLAGRRRVCHHAGARAAGDNCVCLGHGRPEPDLLRPVRGTDCASAPGRDLAAAWPRVPVPRPDGVHLVPVHLPGAPARRASRSDAQPARRWALGMMQYDRFLSRAGEALLQSAIRQMGVMAAQRPDVISFAPGYPAPDTFVWDEYRDIAAELLRGRDANVLQYGPTRGYPALLDVFQQQLHARGIIAAVDELIITTGSQQGLHLLGRVLIDPGDVVLVELPSYTGAIAAFKNAQATLVGVKQQADGIDLAHLDEVHRRQTAAGRRVKFLYVVPNFHNPTGVLTSLKKRRDLLAWAQRADALIVEDDPYCDLWFDDAAEGEMRPIKADDEEGRVIYLSSLSKTLAPAFRVAWMDGPAALIAKFDTAKQSTDLCTSGLDQRIAYEACRRGVLNRQVPVLRQYYQRKRTVMAGALSRELGDLAQWPHPRGGFFLWVALPPQVDTQAMLARAMGQRVIYVAGRPFFVDGSGSSFMRLSFSLPSPERIEEGIRRLAEVVRAELEQAAARTARHSSGQS